jgi:hypothetical protein
MFFPLGGPPAAALFATNARYKREAYRGSEFAPRILADNGIKVVMKVRRTSNDPKLIVNLPFKSDHPVLNSRHLVYEAQQAHYYGLPDNLALAAVTSTPATVMGQDHRIGFIKPGRTVFDIDDRFSDCINTGYDAGESCIICFIPHD